MKKLHPFRAGGWLLLLLVASVLCIRQIGEPDVWWQIRTGQYILEHGSVPAVDVFSYTYQGTAWINVKWLTEVLMAMVSDGLGPEFLMMMQWLALLAMLFLLYKVFKEMGRALLGSSPALSPGVMIALLLFLMGMAYRLNGRPEMVSHVFTALFLFLFVRFQNKKDWPIFLLVPAQMLWANMHEAYGVGLVMLLVFVGSHWLQYYFYDGPARQLHKKSNLKLTLIATAAILSCGIHPSGVRMIWHPLEIFGQLQENKFTSELFSYHQDAYWQQPAYLMMAVLILCLAGGLMIRKKLPWKKLPLFYPVLFLAFLYLSLQAYRNIPFFLIIATPALALVVTTSLKDKLMIRALALASAAGCYLWIASGNYYERFSPKEKYGLRVDPSRNVVGQANYIDQNGITDKGFVDYFSSSYFLWALRPGFETYIDLRDLDIFESLFVKNIFRAYTNPETPTKWRKSLWQVLEDEDDFTYIVMINREVFAPFHKHINSLPQWTMVYTGPNATVYLKDVPSNQKLIAEAKAKDFDQLFHPYGERPTSVLALALSKIFWPFYQEENYQQQDFSTLQPYLQQILGWKKVG